MPVEIQKYNNLNYNVIINPNDTVDYINSLNEELENLIKTNNINNIGKIKFNFGLSKKTSNQDSEFYDGIEVYIYLLKKSLYSGENGYFQGNKVRKPYREIINNKTYNYQLFDNYIKLVFRCKTAFERETLKTLITLLFILKRTKFKCEICDLDYIKDVETLETEMFEFEVYLYVRTKIIWHERTEVKPLEKSKFNGKIIIENNEQSHKNINENFENEDFSSF